ncbi:MAG: hypothetical protein SFZ03_02045 [Candidatus Melainabacteria bacterium]|nr:hypothetical protein [Candidatus Melainabacteria bacterium]
MSDGLLDVRPAPVYADQMNIKPRSNNTVLLEFSYVDVEQASETPQAPIHTRVVIPGELLVKLKDFLNQNVRNTPT